MVPSALSGGGGGGGSSCRRGGMRNPSSYNGTYLSGSRFVGNRSNLRCQLDGQAKTVDDLVEVSL